jgi:hypothetical protein
VVGQNGLKFDRRTERKAHDTDEKARRDSLYAQDIPLGVITVSTSLFSRNEPGNTCLHNGIKPDP